MPTTESQQEYKIVRKLLTSLKPSPENDCLYDHNDADILAFAKKIKAEGLLEPLVITADNYIVSGHRRFAALELLERVKVPCRVLPLRRCDLSKDEYLAELRKYNRQRDKSVAEKVRETMVDLDAEDAYAVVTSQRDKSIRAAECNGVHALVIEGQMRRHAISEDKAEHVKHVLEIVEGRRPFWPLSVRGVHYPLLNVRFVRGYYHPHKDEPGHGGPPRVLYYANDGGSYAATSDLITRLRLGGRLPWSAFADPTRPVREFRPFKNAQEFVTQEVNNLFKGYWRNLLQSQPNHVECLVEKNTVYHMAQQVTAKYQITTRSARGLNGIDSFHDIAEAYMASGKERLILVVLSDYDPEGELIPHDAGRRLRDDFGIGNVKVYKAGVTQEQITRYALPPQNFAKEESSNFNWFVQRNSGVRTVWELEALDPQNMLNDLDCVIRNVLDINLFNAEVEAERAEAPFLEATRRTVREALKGLTAPTGQG